MDGELFWKLVGKEWVNFEEMIRKVNRFLSQEAESAKKARMKGNGWKKKTRRVD